MNRPYLCVVTKSDTYYINVLSEIEQDGTLIKFFANGVIELAIQTEDFIHCKLIVGE